VDDGSGRRGDLPFLSLRRLYVWFCTGIQALLVRDEPAAVSDDATAALAAFPNVTHVQLVTLPELKSLVAGGAGPGRVAGAAGAGGFGGEEEVQQQYR
jgi:disease resistance protein RPS2